MNRRRDWICSGLALSSLVLSGVRGVSARAAESRAPKAPPRTEALIPEVSEGPEALKALERRVTVDRLYADWARPGCLRFEVEAENPHSFDLAIREKHGNGCPGDPHVSPIVDRFRLYRNSDVLLWYDAVEDRYLTYGHVKVSRGNP